MESCAPVEQTNQNKSSEVYMGRITCPNIQNGLVE